MPGLQVALSYLNEIYGNLDAITANKERLLELHAPAEDGEDSLGKLAESARLLLTGDLGGDPVNGVEPSVIKDLLLGLPPTVMEAGRAIIHHNLQRDEPYGMTFAWAPGYESELTVWESPPTNLPSRGWITVLIKGRYPGDAHPVH